MYFLPSLLCRQHAPVQVKGRDHGPLRLESAGQPRAGGCHTARLEQPHASKTQTRQAGRGRIGEFDM